MMGVWVFVLGGVAVVAGLALVFGLERQYARPILIFAILGLIVGVVVGSLRVVPAGHVGVVDFFGTVSPTALKSGLNFVNPLAKVVSMSIRTQEDKEVMSVPSKEGLTIELEISALFHLAPEKAVEVYKTVGPQYANVLFVPQFRAAARGVTGGSEAKALYTSEREALGKLILDHLQALVQERGVEVENVLLRKVALPPTVRDAIEQKLKAEQDFERMKFVNQREEMEAERKRIEAKGVRDAQAIISETLTSQYLNYLWIRNLAENQNVIYVATEANMPIFRAVDSQGALKPKSP
jgi:regulator of protease activity HflC (stomatin/prohibitin superfamily)